MRGGSTERKKRVRSVDDVKNPGVHTHTTGEGEWTGLFGCELDDGSPVNRKKFLIVNFGDGKGPGAGLNVFGV